MYKPEISQINSFDDKYYYDTYFSGFFIGDKIGFGDSEIPTKIVFECDGCCDKEYTTNLIMIPNDINDKNDDYEYVKYKKKS